jgi:predicted aspartyl protease
MKPAQLKKAARQFAVAGIFVALLAPGSQAFGEDCKPLAQYDAIDMTMTDSEHIAVPVSFGAVSKMMIVDTGGVFTEMTDQMATDLGLTRRHSGLGVVDAAGKTSDMVVHAPTFSVGGMSANGVDFIVMQNTGAFSSKDSDVVGIIGPNVLHAYDVDFDFGAKKIHFLSQDHCAGKVVYWPADTVAVIPFQLTLDNHIILPVTLDGHTMNALLDTGSPETILSLSVAEGTFGLTTNASDMKASGVLNGVATATVYRRQFKTLTLEGITIGNPMIAIAPDLQRNVVDNSSAPVNGTRLGPKLSGSTDLILGLNVMRHLHMYIAYGEQKIYVTPAAAPPATNVASARNVAPSSTVH